MNAIADLMNFRNHNLTDEDLVDQEILMSRSAAEPVRPDEYQFLQLPIQYHATPKEVEQAPLAPTDVSERYREERELKDQFAEQVGPVDYGYPNVHEIRRHRYDLANPEHAIAVLAEWTEQFEDLYYGASGTPGVMALYEAVQQGVGDVRRLQTAQRRVEHVLDRIYHSMNTAIIPIFKTHRETLWRLAEQIERTGKASGGFSYELTPEEQERFRQQGLPFQEEQGRLLGYTEFMAQWKPKIGYAYKNVDLARNRAWKAYQRATSLMGNFLLRLAQSVDDMIAAFEAAAYAVEELVKAAQVLDEFNRDADILLATKVMPKAARLLSPDEMLRQGQDPFDQQGGSPGAVLPPLMPGAPLGAPAPTPGPPPAPATLPAPQPPTELQPIPVDDEEFLRVEFPEVKRFPRSIWAKLQFAGAKRRLVSINYTKVTPPEDGVTKNYVVEPYSMRLRRPRRAGGGQRYYFFGFDVADGHIKSFIYRKLNDVRILEEEFTPRWEVEFYWS